MTVVIDSKTDSKEVIEKKIESLKQSPEPNGFDWNVIPDNFNWQGDALEAQRKMRDE